MVINSKNVYSVCIIGCGDIGYKYDRNKSVQGALTHFKSFYTSPHFKIVGVSDINVEITNEINDRFNIPAYDDFRTLIKMVHADVVIVATPEFTHTPILNEVVCAHPRVVICEKPLASRLGEVESLIETYDSENVALAVNYHRRYLKEYVEIKQQISMGKLGNVQSVVIYYSRGFIHNACHYIDLILWWFGKPIDIIPEGITNGLSPDDPTLSILLKYQNGLDIRLIGLKTSDVLINEIDIIGTENRIQIDTMGRLIFLEVGNHPQYDNFRGYFPMEEQVVDFTRALPNLTNNVFQWLEGEDLLKTPVQDSVPIHNLIQKILKKSL